MRYTIKKLDRTVELDDELVSEYTKYKDIRDNTFIIGLKLYYKDRSLNDDELSRACNIILAEDMENIRDNAVALCFIKENRDVLFMNGWGDNVMELSIKQTDYDDERNG